MGCCKGAGQDRRTGAWTDSPWEGSGEGTEEEKVDGNGKRWIGRAEDRDRIWEGVFWSSPKLFG